MKLEHQVTSLELSKKLNELGVKQESYFSWHLDKRAGQEPIVVIGRGYESETASLKGENFAAYTVAELGEMLPDGVASYKRITEKWSCVPPRELHYIATKTTADTEANARAKMLIYLIENNLMEV